MSSDQEQSGVSLSPVDAHSSECAAELGCASGCWLGCWENVTAPACATACATGDAAWLLALVLLLPHLGRLTVEYVIADQYRKKGTKASRVSPRQAKKRKRSGRYAEVQPAAGPGLTMAMLVTSEPWPWSEAARTSRLPFAGAWATARLLCWHIAQPVAVFVAFQASAPQLPIVQWWLGACIVVREALHLALLLVVLWHNRAALLVDVVGSVNSADTTSEEAPEFVSGTAFLALYVAAPEMFLALAWSRPLKDERNGNVVLALSVLCNLGGAAALAHGIASGSLPPPALATLMAMSVMGGVLGILVLKETSSDDSDSDDSDSDDSDSDDSDDSDSDDTSSDSDDSDSSSNSTGSSSDDDDDDTYAEVNRRARAKGFEPKDCGGGGGCFFKSIATSKWGDKTQHKKLRRMVVEELRRNEGKRYSPDGFPAPEEAYLKEMSKDDTYINGQLEIMGTCNVLGVDIGVIGRTAQHDKLGTKCFTPTKGRASRTVVVLHYDTEDPHYRLGKPKAKPQSHKIVDDSAASW